MKLTLAALVVAFSAVPVWADSITEYATGSAIGSVTSSGTAEGYYAGNGGEFAVSAVDAIAEFSLAGLSDTTITSATLELWTAAVTNNANDIAVYGFAGNGVVSSADYQQGTLVEDAGDFSYADTGDEYTINVASIVQSLASSGDSYIGFDIRNVAPVNGNPTNLSDVNFADYYYPPYLLELPTLVVNYSAGEPAATPLPSPVQAGGVLLAGIAGVGLLGRCRRHA